MKAGIRIVSGGTDSHMFLIDLRPLNLKGKPTAELIEKIGITINFNTIPYDPEKPFIASGIRLGTPALTTRGMKEPEMKKIAGFIDRAVAARDNDAELDKIKGDVAELVKGFPLYAERRAEYRALTETPSAELRTSDFGPRTLGVE